MAALYWMNGAFTDFFLAAPGYHHQQPFAFVYKYTFEDGDDPQCVDCIVQYFYRWDYEILACDNGERPGNGLMYKDDADSSPENTRIDLGFDLIIHVKVFALACKYEIHKLKSLSVAKFEAAAQQYGKTHYFTDAAREAYNSAALDNAREMRDAVVEFLHKRRYLLHEDHVKRLMLDKHQLSLDLHLHGPIIPANSSSLPGFGRGFHQIKK
ncbi:hypothetical protein Forpi1262_v017155 [Fusarium oxysporum f. sp. raphani]|uniref:Uncharacterized protein n=1 Tax=Fusarium oxysporum f. sp. raphani TaxID=96318 RepID=A0A8J5U738_FUSOX|nr:hypothetical protein Forpi1262_v017155 [Fusarium oxysporum f. sp. raphani]